jgi:hypothetical protein
MPWPCSAAPLSPKYGGDGGENALPRVAGRTEYKRLVLPLAPTAFSAFSPHKKRTVPFFEKKTPSGVLLGKQGRAQFCNEAPKPDPAHALGRGCDCPRRPEVRTDHRHPRHSSRPWQPATEHATLSPESRHSGAGGGGGSMTSAVRRAASAAQGAGAGLQLAQILLFPGTTCLLPRCSRVRPPPTATKGALRLCADKVLPGSCAEDFSALT